MSTPQRRIMYMYSTAAARDRQTGQTLLHVTSTAATPHHPPLLALPSAHRNVSPFQHQRGRPPRVATWEVGEQAAPRANGGASPQQHSRLPVGALPSEYAAIIRERGSAGDGNEKRNMRQRASLDQQRIFCCWADDGSQSTKQTTNRQVPDQPHVTACHSRRQPFLGPAPSANNGAPHPCHSLRGTAAHRAQPAQAADADLPVGGIKARSRASSKANSPGSAMQMPCMHHPPI
jgi:hypothetical protein